MSDVTRAVTKPEEDPGGIDFEAPLDVEQEFDQPGASQLRRAWMRFKRHKMAMFSLGLLTLLYLSAFLAPVIAPYDPDSGCPSRGAAAERCTPLGAEVLKDSRQPPSKDHLMGTDHLGRDELSRVLYGGRVSLTVGIAVALVAGLLGTFLGSLAGYYGGWLDVILMRVTEMFLIIPALLILLVASRALGGSPFDIVVVVSALAWMPLARIVRGVFLSLKEKEFVEAARASGARARRIILRHMLPNVLGPIIVNVTLAIAGAILTESTLSFLGFGIRPPTSSWGNMIFEAKDGMLSQPWLMMFPGAMIFLTVLCVNFLGDGLRDALDPTGQKIRA